MADFSFLKNDTTKKWTILAPKRSIRPDFTYGHTPMCPFCNSTEPIIHQIGEGKDWQVKVIANKYPFTAIHELIIHSPEHNRNFELLSLSHTELIFQAYQRQYNEYSHKGQVYIFHNRGREAGESIPHPHTQLTVIPEKVFLDILPLKSVFSYSSSGAQAQSRSSRPARTIYAQDIVETDHFLIFCPETSSWPDEVWVRPKRDGKTFGEITDKEIKDIAEVLFSLITIFQLRYDHHFPFNFYIYPGHDWYLRLIPRKKVLGGFEVGTQVSVNTQNPKETIDFIKEHLHAPDIQKILRTQKAEYPHHV